MGGACDVGFRSHWTGALNTGGKATFEASYYEPINRLNLVASLTANKKRKEKKTKSRDSYGQVDFWRRSSWMVPVNPRREHANWIPYDATRTREAWASKNLIHLVANFLPASNYNSIFQKLCNFSGYIEVISACPEVVCVYLFQKSALCLFQRLFLQVHCIIVQTISPTVDGLQDREILDRPNQVFKDKKPYILSYSLFGLLNIHQWSKLHALLNLLTSSNF